MLAVCELIRNVYSHKILYRLGKDCLQPLTMFLNVNYNCRRHLFSRTQLCRDLRQTPTLLLQMDVKDSFIPYKSMITKIKKKTKPEGRYWRRFLSDSFEVASGARMPLKYTYPRHPIEI